jgi:hypothetical protein
MGEQKERKDENGMTRIARDKRQQWREGNDIESMMSG